MRTLSLPFLLLVLFVTADAQTSVPLERAQREFESHDYKRSAESFRQVVSAEPDNVEALSGLIDSLEAAGEWRSAMQPLEHLVALQPANAARINELGRWETWADGNRRKALDMLSRACTLDTSNPQYCTDYASVLAWSAESRPEATALLRKTLSLFPNYVPAMLRLGEILSWSRNTRAEALELYSSALQLDRMNVRAMNGKAQLLAWDGYSSEAMSLYDAAISADPDNVAALRGKAEILNWRGDYKGAQALLERARGIDRKDQRVSAELARAELGMRNYGEAQRIAASLPQEPEYSDVREQVSRAVAPWTEIGFAFRRNGNNLQYSRMQVAVSSPLGFSNRVTFHYTPTLYSVAGDDFNSNFYGAELDSKVNDRLFLVTRVEGDTYPGVDSEITGGLQARYRVSRVWQFQGGFDRSAVDDNLQSLRGTNTLGVLTGQVTSNLFNAGASFQSRRYRFDGTVTYTDGIYSGRNLDSNRRWAMDGNFGKQISGTPYLRLAYGFSYASFEYDADASSPAPRKAGGYFSPTRYLLNYGGLTLSHTFSRQLQIEATGTAGGQNVENSTSAFGNVQFASSFAGRMMWRLGAKDEVRIGYDFLNVYNSFHRHLPSVTWRHYF